MRASASLVLVVAGTVSAADTYPDDPFSRPVLDRWQAFETASGVQPAGNPVQRAADYERNELRAITIRGLPWALWRFACRPGRGAVLCFAQRLSRLPLAITVRVANQGQKPAAFAVSTGEVPWRPDTAGPARQWAVEGDAPVAPGAESEVRFDLARLRPDRAGVQASPQFPTTLNLHVGPLEPGTEYALALREWTVHYPEAPGVSVSAIESPAMLLPNTNAVFALTAPGGRAEAVVDLELRDEPLTLWRVRLDVVERQRLAGSGRVEVRRLVPWYLPGRPLTIGLTVDGLRAGGVQARTTVLNPGQPGFPRVERRLYRGRPTAFVDVEPLAWSGYASYDYQPGNVGEFGAAGANVFVVPVAAGQHVHQIAAPTWTGPDTYDFRQLDERVCLSLQANPEARLLLRVSLALPVSWLQEHPDSIARIRTPAGDVAWEETGTLAASLASEEWLTRQGACLRALIEHCSRQPWAGRVLGFFPTGEVTEEWFAWGCNDGQFADYSATTAAAFANWCQARGYPWRTIPEPGARQRPGWDVYPPDDAGKQSAAYAQFASDLTSDVIAHFCRVVKEATGGRVLAGTFHGYLVQLAGEPRQHLAGQFAVRRLLACPELDFLAGIPLHNFRDLTNGYDLYTSATESILAAGKLFVNENDLFSWLHHAHWRTLYDPADPRGAAIAMHRRVLANDLVHGAERQWFSLLASWHHDTELLAEFARQVEVQSTGVTYDRTPAEEVAFVVDDTSFAWRPPESTLPRVTHADLLYALGRAGAPVGVWLLSDVGRLPNRFRLAVIADATAARPEEIALLKELLQQGGRTVVLVGAPGLVDPQAQRWDEAAPAALTGLPLQVDRAGGPGKAAFTDTGEEVCSIAAVRPRCLGEGLGWLRFPDGPAAGLERPLPDGGRLIWCSVPPSSRTVTRHWLAGAGVHCYAPPEFTVHASRELVAITAPAAGPATLRWPERVQVRDLFDGWQAAGAEFRCPFAAGQTRLFTVSR
jgi:hypothetical protein